MEKGSKMEGVMKKRTLSWLMAIVLLSSVCMSVAAAEPQSWEIASMGSESGVSGEGSILQGVNKKNLSYEFTTVDEEKLSSASEGKPKILIFLNARCSNCRYTVGSLAEQTWVEDGSVDVYAVDFYQNSRDSVRAFGEAAGSGKVKLCYGVLSDTMYQYAWQAGYPVGGRISLPLIVLIDSNNKLQYATNGYTTGEYIESQYLAGLFREKEDEGASSDCTGNNCGNSDCTGDNCGSSDCTGDNCGSSDCTGDNCGNSDCTGENCEGDKGKESVVSAFSDVPVEQGNWKSDAVRYVRENGIMNGISGTDRFEPDSKLTRGMFATVLYRMARNPEMMAENVFSDVADGRYYTQAVLWAYSSKIAMGMGDGSFGVNNDITREQIAKMLCEFGKQQGYGVASAVSLEGFSDAEDVSSWATEYMKWAVDTGMISGKPNGDGSYRLDPKGKATRAECAKMLMMFMQKYAS